MVAGERLYTAEEFENFIARPEHAERLFELINGEIVEKMVSGPLPSMIAAFILMHLNLFVRQHGLGRVTGADGGYMVSGGKYIPDAAYISKKRQPVRPDDAYNPMAPDLAVEVISPSDKENYQRIARLRMKIANYLASGTVVWVVDADVPQVEIYVPAQPVRVLGIGETITGGEVLPGFELPVKDIFEQD